MNGATAAASMGVGGTAWGTQPSRSLDAFLQRDWQNVQDAVKASFFFLAAVLQEHTNEIAALKQQIHDRPTHEQMERALSRHETRDHAEETIKALRMKVEQQQQELMYGRNKSSDEGASLSAEVSRKVMATQSAVDDLQRQMREAAVGLEQVKAEAKRRAALLDDLVTTAAKRGEVATKIELQEMRGRLSSKADKEQVESQLQRRPAWTELEGILRDKADMAIVERLNLHKASVQDFDRLDDRMTDKVGRDEVRGMILTEVQPLLSSLESRVRGGSGATAIESLLLDSTYRGGGHGGMGRGEMESSFAAARTTIHADLELHKETMSKTLESECARLRAEVMGDVQAELATVQAELSSSLAQVSSKVDKLKLSNERAQLELVQVLNRKAYKADLAKAVEGKADKVELDERIMSRAEVAEALATKADVKDLSRLLNAVNEVREAHGDIKHEVTRLAEKMKDKADKDEVHAMHVSAASSSDWRVALGEASLNLRRELGEKANREEVQASIGREVDKLEEKVARCKEACEGKADAHAVAEVEAAVAALGRRVTCELTTGRWLWRSCNLAKGGWIPWEVEVVNAAPDCFIWRKGVSGITAKVPGLYRLAVGVFARKVGVLQVCVNGEPVLTLEPDNAPASSGMAASTTASAKQNGETEEGDRFVTRRCRHSAGEVTSLALHEFIALPPRSVVSVRLECHDRAQGFLMLTKL